MVAHAYDSSSSSSGVKYFRFVTSGAGDMENRASSVLFCVNPNMPVDLAAKPTDRPSEAEAGDWRAAMAPAERDRVRESLHHVLSRVQHPSLGSERASAIALEYERKVYDLSSSKKAYIEMSLKAILTLRAWQFSRTKRQDARSPSPPVPQQQPEAAAGVAPRPPADPAKRVKRVSFADETAPASPPRANSPPLAPSKPLPSVRSLLMGSERASWRPATGLDLLCAATEVAPAADAGGAGAGTALPPFSSFLPGRSRDPSVAATLALQTGRSFVSAFAPHPLSPASTSPSSPAPVLSAPPHAARKRSRAVAGLDASSIFCPQPPPLGAGEPPAAPRRDPVPFERSGFSGVLPAVTQVAPVTESAAAKRRRAARAARPYCSASALAPAPSALSSSVQHLSIAAGSRS